MRYTLDCAGFQLLCRAAVALACLAAAPSAAAQTLPPVSEAVRQALLAEFALPDSDSPRVLVPVRTEAEAKIFFAQRGLTPLDQIRFFVREDRRAIATDLVSDIIGPTRHAFGVVVSDVDESKEGVEPSTGPLEKLFAAGGDAYLNVAYPLLSLPGWPSADGSAAPLASASVYALPRLGFLLPAMGTAVDNPEVSADFAFEVHLALGRPQSAIQYFAQLRHGYLMVSRSLAAAIALPPEDTRFVMGQWVAGVQVSGILRLSFQGVTTAPAALRSSLPIRFVVQLAPLKRE